ncbi:hypothetical protein GC163_20550 [bacterium]|nr:hypothetical protein [bacterium]
MQQYVASGQYAALLAQPETATTELLTTIEGLDLLGLAPAKAGVAAYVKCYRGDNLQFTTPSAPWGNTAYFQQIRRALPGAPGEPLYFEVWNDGWRDELLGGFVLYPTLNATADPTSPPKMQEQTQSVRILWDWKDRSLRTQVGVAHLRLRLIPVQ